MEAVCVNYQTQRDRGIENFFSEKSINPSVGCLIINMENDILNAEGCAIKSLAVKSDT